MRITDLIIEISTINFMCHHLAHLLVRCIDTIYIDPYIKIAEVYMIRMLMHLEKATLAAELIGKLRGGD